jgi:bifunctional DNase/RNase
MGILKRKRRIMLFITIVLWLAALILSHGLAGAEDIRLIASDQNGLLPVEVHQLIIDPRSQQPVVILADSLEERGLYIWISHFEANAIHSEMNGIDHFRPLTHDLLERVIKKANLRIQRIIVTHIQKGVYYATLMIEEGGKVIEIDARPSDSIVMALKFNAPIFVSKKLFEEASVLLKEPVKVEEPYGLALQDLTPSLAEAFSFGSTHGVLVSGVRKKSRAERDGIQRGDIIVEIGASMRSALKKSGVPVEVRIFRKAQLISIAIHP